MSNDKPNKTVVQVDWKAASVAGATSEPVLLEKYANELLGATFFHDGTPQEDRIKRLNALLSLAQSLEPRDMLEAQLIAQMIASHNAAIECVRRFNIHDQTYAGKELYMKHSTKFMNLYISQMKALRKYRGQGDQKMVIEHVNVAPGGQAIVGNVTTNTTKSKAQTALPETRVIEHIPDLPLPIQNKNSSKAKAAVSNKLKKK